MTLPFPNTLADRFAFKMRAVLAAVAARIRCPQVTAAIIVHVRARPRRIAAAFEKRAAVIRAGNFSPRPAGRRRGAYDA